MASGVELALVNDVEFFRREEQQRDGYYRRFCRRDMMELMMDLQKIGEVPGHTKQVAGFVLAGYASMVPAEQAIVEIGVYRGRSACYLGEGAKAGHGAHVWAIDPWDLPGERFPYAQRAAAPRSHRFTWTETRLECEQNVRNVGLSDQVTLVRGLSVDVGNAWNGPRVGMLHVDGDHRYQPLMDEWDAWRLHLAPGAVVCFDDHVPTCADVMRAVEQFVQRGDLGQIMQATRRLAVARFRS